MKMIGDNMCLPTPIYVKVDDNFKWPNDRFFYLIASDGLFRCRNHEFFRSCTPMKGGPKDLASQTKFLKLSYPLIPQALVERAVGFFRLVAEKQNTEAAVILVWNRQTKQVELLCPEQTGINSGKSASSPHGYPMDVKYEIPPLAQHLALIGDMHCHVDGGAYASGTDEHDEIHRPGIHIVVGKIHDQKPAFFCEAVSDGERFSVDDLSLVWEGFDQADTQSVPQEWVDKVKVKTQTYATYGCGNYWEGGSSDWAKEQAEKKKADKEIMQRELAKFAQREVCPKLEEIKSTLFKATKLALGDECEERAAKFIKAWDKIKKGRNEALIGKE